LPWLFPNPQPPDIHPSIHSFTVVAAAASDDDPVIQAFIQALAISKSRGGGVNPVAISNRNHPNNVLPQHHPVAASPSSQWQPRIKINLLMAIRQHFDLLASILLILFLQLRWTSEAREGDASSCLDQLQVGTFILFSSTTTLFNYHSPPFPTTVSLLPPDFARPTASWHSLLQRPIPPTSPERTDAPAALCGAD
jgi:hypothetical protein